MIDSSAAQNSELLQNSLLQLNIQPEQVDLVLHSHGHADHFGCSHLFKNAEFKMHKFDAEFVNKKDPEFTASSIIPTAHFPEINDFLSENQVLDLGGFKLRVISTPGHTQGSICFFEESQGLLFSGDTVFRDGFGRVDLPSGSAEQLLASVKKISALNLKFLLPGHGPITDSPHESLDSALHGIIAYL